MPAPHRSVFAGRMPFLPPNQQRQSTEGKGYSYKHYYFGRQQGHAALMLTKPEVSTPRSVSQRPQTGKPMAVNRFHHIISDVSFLRQNIVHIASRASSA